MISGCLGDLSHTTQLILHIAKRPVNTLGDLVRLSTRAPPLTSPPVRVGLQPVAQQELTGRSSDMYGLYMSSTPLYVRIRAGLESQIQSGELPPGARVPTEAELQAAHGVSRSVAQRVLNDLAHAGLVVRRKRLGTYVAEGARQVNLLRSLNPKVLNSGLPGRMEVVSAEVIPASKAEIPVPGFTGDEPVTQMIRVRHDADNTPTVIEISIVPFALAPRLLDEHLETFAIRAHFDKNKVKIAKSRMYFDPVLVEQRHADLLSIDPGVAVLRRRRYMWQPNGDIAEAAAYYLRPDAFEFFIEYADTTH